MTLPSYAHILPEIWRNIRDRNEPAPSFPDTCPACGAVATMHGDYYSPVAYACGAAYTEKPQIQNHTDKWWGSCPVTRAANAGA